MRELGELLPKIVVEPPGPKSREIAEILKKYETPALSPLLLGEKDLLGFGGVPIAWKQARGANIVDVDENIYIDLTAGFCVAIAGHCHPAIIEAIKTQAEILIHAPAADSPNIPRAKLLEKLAEITHPSLTRSHILSSGSEAIDLAMKLARLYTKGHSFIAFHGSFHGKTLGPLSLTSRKYYRQQFLPLIPEVVHLPYAYCYRCAFNMEYPECDLQCLRYFEYVISDPATAVTNIAAVFMEPIQGHEGWVVPPREFIRGIKKICEEYGILMVLDEIITGFGRTGKMFCFEHYDIVPDILVCGKGMSSGFPISAVVATDKVMSAWTPFKHTSTFSANPLGCAASLANIEVILKENLIERCARLGEYFLKALCEIKERHRFVGEVRGKGLMVALELVKDESTKKPIPEETGKVVREALKRGVYLQRPGGKFANVLKISPPLVISKEQIDFAINVLDESIKVVEKSG